MKRSLRFAVLAVLAAGAVVTTQCCPLCPNPIPTPKVEVHVDNRLLAANSKLGFDLFAKIAERDASKNVLASPTSIAMALALAYNGATGETQQAMAKTLQLQDMSLQEVNQAYAELRSALSNLDPKVELDIANALWAAKDGELKADFVQRNRQFYAAEVGTLDFQDPKSVETINQWVSQNTRGKINGIVDRMDADTLMIVCNAMYFKGEWQDRFDKAMTKDGPFHLPNGQEKQVPLMSHSGNFPYLRGDRFQAVSLPYGQGRVSMYIFLPNADSSLSEFLKELNAENWAKWMPQFGSTEVYLKVPRFKIEYSTSLEEPLKALGMGIALDRNLASFEGIRPAPPNLYIQQVKHKVFVEVNEEGTVAAAATHFSFGAGAAMPVQFVVDRPFFFAIRDNTTGTVLFMGAINEP